MVLVFAGDLHAKHINPASRTDDYNEAFFKKLGFIEDVLRKTEASALIVGGDVFNDVPSTVPHSLVNRLIETFGAFPCPVAVSPGNHDMVYRKLSLMDATPLGVLAKAHAVNLVTTTDVSEPLRVWSPEGDMEVEIHGRQYVQDEDLGFLKSVRYEKTDAVKVLSIHHNVDTHAGRHYNEPQFSYEQLSKGSGAPFDLVNVGHLHTDGGIQEVSDTVFMRLGALMRGSLRYEDINRVPAVAGVRVSWEPFKSCSQLRAYAGKTLYYKWSHIRLPVEPVSSVFDLEAYEQRKEEGKSMDKFIAELASTSVTSVDPLGMLRELQMGPSIRSTVIEYLGRAERSLG